MAFTSTYRMVNGVAQITLSGELDASSAPVLKADIEKAAAAKAKSVALLMKGLEYMSSAGVRVLVFAKQKMGAQVNLYLIGVQEFVRETLEMTGLLHSVVLLDEYDAAQIEKV